MEVLEKNGREYVKIDKDVYDKVLETSRFDIDDVLVMFKDQIDSGELTDESLAYVLNSFKIYKEKREEYIGTCIRTILETLYYVKFFVGDAHDPELIRWLISSELLLYHKLSDASDETVNVPRLYKEMYYNVIKDLGCFENKDNDGYERMYNGRKVKIPEGVEEFSFDHFLDLEYHLKNLQKWANESSNPYVEGFKDIIDRIVKDGARDVIDCNSPILFD